MVGRFRASFMRTISESDSEKPVSPAGLNSSRPNSDKGPQPMTWPYQNLIETRSINLDGEIVSLSQWRQEADRSLALREDPDFLLASDPSGFFDSARIIFCGPYPRATAALCKNFGQASKLVESLGVSLLIILPQNLLLPDLGKSLLSLMRRLPDLKVQIYTGSSRVVELLAGAPEVSRIEFLGLPVHPHDFHSKIAQVFRFELPEWFVRRE